MQRLLVRSLSFLALLAIPVVPGCVCVADERFFGLPDAGEDAGEEPPPPPVFPLKAGDELVFPGIVGRAEGCGAAEGGCDRALKATFTIKKVKLDSATNTWSVDADYLYEATANAVDAAAIGRLFLSHVAPFADIAEGGSESGTATFRTGVAPTDEITPNGFPFFHFEASYANREDSAYRQAADAFRERILELDPEANIGSQAAESKIEAYFKDELGAQPMLHKIRVDYHPFGFMCAWDERLTEWQNGMQRTDNAFAGTQTPLAGTLIAPIELIRDDQRFICSCLTQRCTVRGDNSKCLDPSDPDAEPGACN